MTAVNEQLVVNGSFQTGNLDGWGVLDPAKHIVMEYSQNRHCVVQLPASGKEALTQYFWAEPGTYQLSVMHRATNEQGRPVDVRTLHGGGVSFTDSHGNLVTSPMLLVSKQAWGQTSTEVVIEAGEPPTEIKMSFQNIDNSASEALGRSLGIQFEESPFALTKLSFWRIR